jgi:hypothetical protein
MGGLREDLFGVGIGENGMILFRGSQPPPACPSHVGSVHMKTLGWTGLEAGTAGF